MNSQDKIWHKVYVWNRLSFLGKLKQIIRLIRDPSKYCPMEQEDIRWLKRRCGNLEGMYYVSEVEVALLKEEIGRLQMKLAEAEAADV